MGLARKSGISAEEVREALPEHRGIRYTYRLPRDWPADLRIRRPGGRISPGALLAARRPKGPRRLQSVPVVDSPAPVAELVDALDSGSSGRKPVEVRVLSGALSATPYGTPCTAQVLKLVDRPD